MQDEVLWPLVVYLCTVIGLVALVLAASHFIGERHNEEATGDPFESGMVPVHRARFRIQAKFYVVAVLFVIFDVEAVFIITWAVVAREAGWAGYIEIAIFIAVLTAALAYLWGAGALNWASSGRYARRPAASAGGAGPRAHPPGVPRTPQSVTSPSGVAPTPATGDPV